MISLTITTILIGAVCMVCYFVGHHHGQIYLLEQLEEEQVDSTVEEAIEQFESESQ